MSDLRAALVTALDNIEMKKQMQNNELKATINEWASEDKQEPDVKPAAFKSNSTVSRDTFDAVLDNPGKNNGEIVRMMEAKGHKRASVGSLLAQMVRQNLIRRDENGCFYAEAKEYTPLKGLVIKKTVHLNRPKRAYVKSGKYTTKEGIAALDTHTTLAAPAPAFDVEELLSTLSFPQVLTLYKKIKTLLGEAA